MWKVPAMFEIMDVHLSMINICGNPKIFLKEKIHLRNKAIMHVLPSEEIQTTCTCIFVMSATINKCAQNLSDLNTLQNFLPHLFQLLRTLNLCKGSIYDVIPWHPQNTLKVKVQAPEIPTET